MNWAASYVQQALNIIDTQKEFSLKEFGEAVVSKDDLCL
jgi:hypothetical protein